MPCEKRPRKAARQALQPYYGLLGESQQQIANVCRSSHSCRTQNFKHQGLGQGRHGQFHLWQAPMAITLPYMPIDKITSLRQVGSVSSSSTAGCLVVQLLEPILYCPTGSFPEPAPIGMRFTKCWARHRREFAPSSSSRTRTSPKDHCQHAGCAALPSPHRDKHAQVLVVQWPCCP